MPTSSKLMTVSEATKKFIHPGSHIAFGGFSLSRNAMSIAHEIIRNNIGDLRVSSVNPSYSVDILIGAGLVSQVESGCLNMERLGLPKNFCRAVQNKTLKSEDYEHGTMTFRYLAGALGMPFIPTKSMLGSDLLSYQVTEAKKFELMNCPFTDQKVAIVPACLPDVAVVHVTRADEQGNSQIDGTAFSDEFIAKASKKIIIVTEELLSNEQIRNEPHRTIIPGYRVSAVVHCPWGAYPTAVQGCYDYDYEALKFYQKSADTPEIFNAYLDKYVRGVKDFEEYLELAGTHRTYQRLAIQPKLGYSAYTSQMVGGNSQVTEKAPGEYNLKEFMIIAAARQLKDNDVVVAGTGLPMAATTVAKLSHAPNCYYVVETGIGDVKPKHTVLSVADPRLTGAARPAFVANTLEGLGFLVHKGLADVGFLGGAQIDKFGNLNATVMGDYHNPKKRFPGSGGANVIASCAKRLMIIMKHEKRRFMEKVDYITSPGFLSGGNSRFEAGLIGGGPDKVISDLAVLGFEPESKRMMLLSVHPGVTVEQVIENTGFELLIPEHVPVTDAPTETELAILRANISPVYFAD